MTITFQCDCGKRYRVKPELVGKRAKCTACGSILEVPLPEPQLEDLSLLGNSMATLPPAQSSPLGPAPGLAKISPPDGAALGNNTYPTQGGQPTADISLWLWCAVGSGVAAAIIAVGLALAIATAGNLSSSPVTPPRIAAGSPPSPPASMLPSSIGRTTETSEQADWPQTFQSAHGGYSADFPGQPKHREDQVQTRRGKLSLHVDYVMSFDGAVFAVSYLDDSEGGSDPKQRIERAARNAVAGMVDGSGGKIIETRDSSVQGAASKRYVIESVRDGLTFNIHVVFVLTSDRLYYVSWAGEKGLAREADIARFINSFRTNS